MFPFRSEVSETKNLHSRKDIKGSEEDYRGSFSTTGQADALKIFLGAPALPEPMLNSSNVT